MPTTDSSEIKCDAFWETRPTRVFIMKLEFRKIVLFSVKGKTKRDIRFNLYESMVKKKPILSPSMALTVDLGNNETQG